MSGPVELLPALSWDCPECGREQFERVVCHIDDENIETWLPMSVVCQHCETAFEAVPIGEEESDDDEVWA